MSAARPARDGIHGATMASTEFGEDSEAKRPTVQVGDPFTEKLLIEACLELMATDAIVAIQDMGAAGLTSSSVEMAGKGEVGIELDLDHVPQRETGMTAYEMMLSESQERMLMVLRPDRQDVAARDLRKVGTGFRGDRPSDRHRPDRHPPSRHDRGGYSAGAARRPGAALPPPLYRGSAARPARRRRRSRRHRGRAAAPDRQRGSVLARLDLGPVRQHRRRPDRAPAWCGGRRNRPHRGPRHGPGADHRLHAALLHGRRLSGRRAGGGRGVAQHQRHRRHPAGDYRQHEISATRRSPK